MAAIKMETLVKLEEEYGLKPDDLSYQHRCSRITAYINGEGESWEPPAKKEATGKPRPVSVSPLYGKKILISPLIIPDKNRMLYYDEILGPEMETQDLNAGEQIYNMDENTQRLMTDYKITSVRPDKHVVAKSHVPKANTELSFTIGKDLAIVCRGANGKTGYVWSYPVQDRLVEHDGEATLVRIWGLQSLIRQIFPEIESQFKNEPLMSYIDGLTLVANIPMTHDIIAKARRQRMIDERAGIDSNGFLTQR